MDKPDVSLDRMRTFVRVAERMSVSSVARELGLGQSTVSRQLSDLERAVGTALLSRTTRRLALTEEGARFYDRCLEILRLVERARDEAKFSRAAAMGTVRISATSALGVLHLTRLLFDFQDEHPEIAIDLSLKDEKVDLVKEGADLAIRLGPVSESSLKLRRIGWSARMLTAAPTYLERHGRPRRPEDLHLHEGIRMSNIAGSDTLRLIASDGKTHSAPFGGRLRVDHGLAVRQALLAARGIAPTHRWLVDDLMENGQLERLLPEYKLDPVPLSLLIVPQRALAARVKLMADFLVEAFRTVPGITPP